MQKTRIHAAVALALLVAGCGQVGAPTNAMLPPTSSALKILQVDTSSECGPADAQSQTSSTYNEYFRTAYLTDGNTHSAWRPAADDACPSIDLCLDGRHGLCELGIKMSGDATVSVAVWDGAAWCTVATGLSPTQGEFVKLPLPHGTAGSKVRLTFDGDTSELRVCEVEVCTCGPAPSTPPSQQPTPTPTPSQTVEPTPTPTPSQSVAPTPTPTPTPLDCGTMVTGGPTATFGSGLLKYKVDFSFEARTSGTNRGTINLVDHRLLAPHLKGKVTSVSCVTGNTVMFSGLVTEGGIGTFTAIVTDNGEPGSADAFSFSTSWGYAVNSALGAITGGNIQIHH